MLGRARGRSRIALLAGVFAIGIGGCGGGDDGTIPMQNSENLLTLLTQVQDQFQSGNCTLAEDSANDLINEISALPDDVDPELARALTSGAEQLTKLTEDDENCAQSGVTGETDVEPTEEPDTSTTSTTTTTTTTEEEPPPPEETEEEPPTGDGQDQDPTPPTGDGQGNPGGGNGGVGPATGGVEPEGKR